MAYTFMENPTMRHYFKWVKFLSFISLEMIYFSLLIIFVCLFVFIHGKYKGSKTDLKELKPQTSS